MKRKIIYEKINGDSAIITFNSFGFYTGYLHYPMKDDSGIIKENVDTIYKNGLLECYDVHGGITFFQYIENTQDSQHFFSDKDGVVIGFDCNHINDISNPEMVLEMFGEDEYEKNLQSGRIIKTIKDSGATFKNIDFVRENLKYLSDWVHKNKILDYIKNFHKNYPELLI